MKINQIINIRNEDITLKDSLFNLIQFTEHIEDVELSMQLA